MEHWLGCQEHVGLQHTIIYLWKAPGKNQQASPFSVLRDIQNNILYIKGWMLTPTYRSVFLWTYVSYKWSGPEVQGLSCFNFNLLNNLCWWNVPAHIQSMPIKVFSVLVCHKTTNAGPPSPQRTLVFVFHYVMCIKSMTEMAHCDLIILISARVSLETNVVPWIKKENPTWKCFALCELFFKGL